MICVLRSLTPELMDEALASLGVQAHNKTPYLETTTGISCSFWLFPEEMAKLDTVISPPDVLCDYREDEEGGERPMYTCTNGTDTWQQSAGWFA